MTALSRVALVAFVLAGASAQAKAARPSCRVVKVVDGKGRPIAGATVFLWECDFKNEACTPPTNAHEWFTDRRGRICAEELLEVDAGGEIPSGGALEVTAPGRFGGGCAGGTYWAAYPKGVPEARGTRPIVVRLDIATLATGPLKGRITAADGRPIKGATVDIETIVVNDTCSFWTEQSPVKSSADGRFSFAAVAKGSARLRIRHPDFVPRSGKAVVPSSDNEIVLDQGATWQGRVFDPDGAPLAACRVSAATPSGVVATSACSEGKFSLRLLPPGDVDVGVGTEEDSPLGGRAWKMKTPIVAGEHRQQDLPWPKGVTVAGVIVDDAGAPIAEARLSALPRGADRPPSAQHPQEVIVRADGNGQFTFRHLAPGPWVIKGDYRAVLKGPLGKLEVDATTNQTGLRLVVPERAVGH